LGQPAGVFHTAETSEEAEVSRPFCCPESPSHHSDKNEKAGICLKVPVFFSVILCCDTEQTTVLVLSKHSFFCNAKNQTFELNV
jgi:hypothetical protein